MALKNLQPGPKYLRAELVCIMGKMVTDGSGDPVAATSKMRGVTTFAKTATGKYKLTLEDNFAGGVVFFGGSSPNGAVSIDTDNSTSGSDPHVIIAIHTNNALADLVSGTAYFKLELARRAA